MSEGNTRDEEGGTTYYGSTSVFLARERDLGSVGLDLAAALLKHDPHVRLFAVRIARREAAVRASAPIGTMRAELSVGVRPDGLFVTVDVAARVRLRASLSKR